MIAARIDRARTRLIVIEVHPSLLQLGLASPKPSITGINCCTRLLTSFRRNHTWPHQAARQADRFSGLFVPRGFAKSTSQRRLKAISNISDFRRILGRFGSRINVAQCRRHCDRDLCGDGRRPPLPCFVMLGGKVTVRNSADSKSHECFSAIRSWLVCPPVASCVHLLYFRLREAQTTEVSIYVCSHRDTGIILLSGKAGKMFRIEAESTHQYCDGISRRSFVQVGVAGMASVGLADVLRAKEQSVAAGQKGKETSVILIWLDGGPGHLDMYDMKPDAPAEYRGIWRPIPKKSF